MEPVSLKLGLLCLGLIAAFEAGVVIALATARWDFRRPSMPILILLGLGVFTLTALLPGVMAIAVRRLRFIHLAGIGLLGLSGVGWLVIFLISSQNSSWFTLISAALAFAHFGSTVYLYAPKPEG